jgi:hypothetical protein
MDIKKLKAEFEKLKYIEEKLEYLNFDEHLGCYVEKNNGMPVGLAAWVNGAFYGFEQAAKAQAVPDGFVLVAKKSVEHWYLDEGESLWMDEPDNWLCDMDVGAVQEVEHKEYIVTESNTLYATKVWDGENQDVSSWEFFNSKDDAEKAAEYCKAMIEAQEQAND